jgi:hypothetical protein
MMGMGGGGGGAALMLGYSWAALGGGTTDPIPCMPLYRPVTLFLSNFQKIRFHIKRTTGKPTKEIKFLQKN